MTVAGLLLLVLGAGLVVAEAHLPSHGGLGAAGVTALVAGVILAVAGAGAGLAIAIPIAAVISAAAAGGLFYVGRRVGGARRIAVRAGTESLVGRVGVLREWSDPEGCVFLDGGLWRARRSWSDEQESLSRGDRVIVERVSGLTLSIRRAEEWEALP
jgi:membrane-bound serine protease (ClpP class)